MSRGDAIKAAVKRYGDRLLNEELARGILPTEQALLDRMR